MAKRIKRKQTDKLNRGLFLPGIEFVKRPEQARVIYFANNYDVTSSGLKGADRAPTAIKQCLERQIEPWERHTGTDLTTRVKFHWADPGNLNKLSPTQMVKRVESNYLKLFRSNKKNPPFIITIGGDHSSPIGVFKALAKLRNPNDITILHIDAHLDMRDTDEFRVRPFGHDAHCSVMRRASELGFKIVSIGIRDYSDEELRYARGRRGKISFFEMGLEKPWSISTVLAAIKTKFVYITVDVDGFDPSVFPITGTPVPGGLTWDFGVELLKKVCKNKTIIGADICEAAVSSTEPFATHRTIFSAAKLAYLIPCLALGEKSG